MRFPLVVLVAWVLRALTFAPGTFRQCFRPSHNPIIATARTKELQLANLVSVPMSRRLDKEEVAAVATPHIPIVPSLFSPRTLPFCHGYSIGTPDDEVSPW